MLSQVFEDTPAFWSELEAFTSQSVDPSKITPVVAEVLAAVRERGDAAVLHYTQRFDGATLSAGALRVTAGEIRAASKSLAAADRAAIREAIGCVREFHRRTLPRAWTAKNPHGAVVGERFYPIERVGLYIPGGNVPLVSTVIMTAVLAKLAGCRQIVVCTPPGPDGMIASAMLAALALVGVEEVYKVGGIQAIGAMAFGTGSIPKVDKIFGPGNGYVIEAKRQVFGEVGIDLLPGPSEVMVIADAGADPEAVAYDLMAQAEHGSGKEVVFLVTTSKRLLKAVEAAFTKHVDACGHAEKIRSVLAERTLAIHVANLDQAVRVANFVAPEHLELQVADKAIAGLSRAITTAGALLQGYSTPTVLGDFTAGPSHTLPTGRAGRFFSGLQLVDFMRRSSIVRYSPKSAAKARAVVETFARLEQLDAHGRSLTLRLDKAAKAKPAQGKGKAK